MKQRHSTLRFPKVAHVLSNAVQIYNQHFNSSVIGNWQPRARPLLEPYCANSLAMVDLPSVTSIVKFASRLGSSVAPTTHAFAMWLAGVITVPWRNELQAWPDSFNLWIWYSSQWTSYRHGSYC